MKMYIKSSFDDDNYCGVIASINGRLADTGERCVMQRYGCNVGGGRRTTTYIRVDKPDYNSRGERVFRQYSMDRQHRFWLESEDRYEDYMDDWIIREDEI